jgi:hypothetical protein
VFSSKQLDLYDRPVEAFGELKIQRISHFETLRVSVALIANSVQLPKSFGTVQSESLPENDFSLHRCKHFARRHHQETSVSRQFRALT